MAGIVWNEDKNKLLKKTRKIGFEKVVPFVDKENKLFLKTIYASRKYTKIYLKRRNK